ncbi:MAG: stage III sporulation protein AE [Clostridia bacterium]|nr:stage III sporulation protein AE [Clostridia bacterium]
MWLRIIKRICLGLVCICIILNLHSFVFAEDNIVEEVKNAYGLDDTIDILEEYVKEVDLSDMTNDLLKGEALDMSSLLDMFFNLIFKEIKIELRTLIRILVVIVLIAIIKCLELDKGSLENVINVISFLVITVIILKNYIDILDLFKNTISALTKVTEIVSPIILGLLIATGEILTSGIIGPAIMFLTSLCGLAVSYVVLPLLNIMLVFKIISSISESVNLDKLGEFSGKFAMWITSIMFALVLGVLGLESSVSTSVDAVTVKTTQAAVSNLIPVVGKFVSDSAEIVMGASEIIGKTIGAIGIIVIVITVATPILKLFIISLIYGVIEGIAVALMKECKTTKLIGAFSKQYSTLAGIMVGISCVFVITLALAISLFGKAVAS